MTAGHKNHGCGQRAIPRFRLTGRKAVRQAGCRSGSALPAGKIRIERGGKRYIFNVIKKNTSFSSQGIDSFGKVNIL